MRPRPYLSPSQLIMLETSEATYIKNYIKGNRMRSNKGQELGSQIADCLDTGEMTGDPIKDLLISKMPKFENTEVELLSVLKIDGMKIPLLGRMDTATRSLKGFKDHKTGQKAWTQKQVDNNSQLTFYATQIRLLKGFIPEDIELVYAPTKKNADGILEPTGEVIVFKTTRSLVDILKMQNRMKKAWIRIGELSDQYLL